MGGGLMQLVAYGAQDIYLTGNPQITFFKVIYRRHTNFAIETVEHPFVGTVGFGNRLTAKITRNGDLVSKMYLRVILNSVDPQNKNFAWVRRVGHAIIREVEIDIGGTKVDRQYGTWLDVWYELARHGDHERAYANMIGDVPSMTDYNKTIKPEYILYIPLQFWFNKFIGLAIPLIALQYHETNIYVQLENVNKLIVSDGYFDINNVSLKDITILVNYIYLDTDERRRFALVGHEYLIEQIQYNGSEPAITSPTKYTLDFNHPTKELIWAIRNGNYYTSKSFLYYTNSDKWSVTDAACLIVQNSIEVGESPEASVPDSVWEQVLPNSVNSIGKLNINNKTQSNVWVNQNSLSIGSYGITNKIAGDITITFDNVTKETIIQCSNIVTTLTVRDLSFPVEQMTDTRYNKKQYDPRVNTFSNYGILIDGTGNPVEYGLLQFNGHDRFDRREGMYFNYVQSEQHHENTPKDGINCYSFALYPEEHQPSGTSNLSRIESSQLTLWYIDSTFVAGSPELNFLNDESQLWIFATNYNILRIFSGLSGLAYVS
ncbi:major capsid protein [Fadolivirus algeromassiliense]|jgi:hypothetical protein|uniref:Major capsid protein n=1 Tax=Fadolivirus FV1/VV64 TaxID=3070911 RepID=A0A7D3QU66_9VIRU|nr:major capsid protein [Fadolivirus algeromassiliense]QKF93905.1 major capsid protein [Fadolivirus FV1/VV64]